METLQERLDELNTKYIVYGKDNCPFCNKAKALLTNKNQSFQYLIMGKDYTREELLELAPDAKTVPQIWVDSNGELFHIGGYMELENHFKDPVEAALNEGLTLSVVFTKVDGTERTMLCTKNSQHIPEEKMPTQSDHSGNLSNIMRVYDIENQDWRSFRLESVKSYTVIMEENA